MHTVFISFLLELAELLVTLAKNLQAHASGNADAPVYAAAAKLTNPVTGEVWTPGKKGPKPAW